MKDEEEEEKSKKKSTKGKGKVKKQISKGKKKKGSKSVVGWSKGWLFIQIWFINYGLTLNWMLILKL